MRDQPLLRGGRVGTIGNHDALTFGLMPKRCALVIEGARLRPASFCRCLFAEAAAARPFSPRRCFHVFQRASGTVFFSSLPSRITVPRHPADRCVGEDRRQVTHLLEVLDVELDDHVASLMPLARGPCIETGNQAPRGGLMLSCADLWGHWWNAHASQPRGYSPNAGVIITPQRSWRDRKAMPSSHRWRDDGGVDADH